MPKYLAMQPYVHRRSVFKNELLYIQAVFISRSQESSVGIEMAYGWTAGVRLSAGSKIFFFTPQRPAAQPASYIMFTRSSFPGAKAAGA
jgi:hypothetical protein